MFKGGEKKAKGKAKFDKALTTINDMTLPNDVKTTKMRSFIIIALVVGFISCNHTETLVKTGFEGKPIPEFKVLLIDSVTYLNSKDIPKGMPVVILVFGPQCAYSRAQIKEIVGNITKEPNITFYVITPWSFPEMKAFYNEFALGNHSNLIAGFDYENALGQYFGMQGVPFTAVYDKHQLLRASFLGPTTYKLITELAL